MLSRTILKRLKSSLRFDEIPTAEYRKVEQFKAQIQDIPAGIEILTAEHIKFSFSKSSGPGGQHVNKGILHLTPVNTKATLTAANIQEWIPLYVLERAKKHSPSRFSQDNEIIISTDSFKSQEQNRKECLEKLRQMLSEASYLPPPPSTEKMQRIRQGYLKAKKEREESKRFHSEKKSTRTNSKSMDF